MSYKIITISRQSGSGGNTIAKMLSAKLGIPHYDQDLVEKFSEKSGYAKEFIAQNSEYAQKGGWLATALAQRDMSGRSLQDHLFLAQREVILNLAEQGPCVIVGRCSDFILRDRHDVLNVFIHADMPFRVDHIETNYGRTEDTEKRLRDRDKRRSSYYRFYTDEEWGDATRYHLAIDSSALGIERTADLIADIYSK